MRSLVVLVCLWFFLSKPLSAQVINGYAKVTAISGTVLTVSNVNETAHTFEDDEWIVIMQMQDNVIGGNTGDNVNFGNLGAIGSAGLYEVKRIVSHTESAGLPATITVSGSLTNTYNTGANSSVQIITFRRLSAGNYTTTADMAAMDWDGNVGGVIALNVGGTLTLAHNITANGAGFRGGLSSTNYYNSGEGCHLTVWRTSDDHEAEKGEGIFKRTNNNHRYGRAKILNGGGGGNHVNAGGGGGGNYTTGGQGGPGWSCGGGNNVGGRGGIELTSSISRVFMGGGGGGGQQNDGASSAGGDGGGIVLIKANQIATSGTCGGRVISANGLGPANSGNDGAGGGGAGGSIVFDVPSYSVVGTCGLSVQASGGNGGSTVHADVHGGGGGGGQGRVIYSIVTPATNITTTTNNGTSGCNNNSNPCTSTAGTPTGSNGQGISGNAGVTPLPVQLLNFRARYNNDHRYVAITWTTASEVNNDQFILEKSDDGEVFYPAFNVQGKGTTQVRNDYAFDDYELYKGVMYYRLTQVDFDKTSSVSEIISVRISEDITSSLSIFPNPLSQKEKLTIKIHLPGTVKPAFSILDTQGVEYKIEAEQQAPDTYTISTEGLPEGFTILKVKAGSDVFIKKLVIKTRD